MLFESVITRFAPQLSPARSLALTAYLATANKAAAEIDAVAEVWAPVVERLADVKVAALQPRLTPDAFITLGRVQRLAADLRLELDRRDTPDFTASVRAARSAADDKAFTSCCQALDRGAKLYAGKADNVKRLAAQLHRDLQSLESLGDAAWSEAFTVAPVPFGSLFVSTK